MSADILIASGSPGRQDHGCRGFACDPQDVDLDGGKLRVERSLEQTKAGLRFKAPKTKHGRRTITIPPSTVAELRAHRRTQQEQRLALGAGKASADALVFPTWEGKARSPNALTKEWSVAMAEAGLNVTLHALRHTHASSLIAAGVDVLTISRRLGHASPTITLGIYGHLFSNTDDRAAQVIETLFAKVVRTE
jgi:integrase